MPIEEVIERGREVGLAINPSDVHSTRYYMRQEEARGAPKVQADAATDEEEAVDVATTVRRNYQLLESQRASEWTQETDRKAVPAKQKKKAASVAESRVKPAAFAVKRKKSAAIIEGDTSSLEETLRRIVTRIGADRAREIILDLETLRLAR